MWFVGVFVADWHERTVRHVVCETHGDLMEISAAELEDEAAIYAATSDEHESCALPVPNPARPVGLTVLLRPAGEAPFVNVPRLRLPGASAPPLRYAPKTSPPRA